MSVVSHSGNISNVQSSGWLWACTPKAREVLNKCYADVEARMPNCNNTPAFNKLTSAEATRCINMRWECSKKAAPYDPKNAGKYLMDLMDLEADFEEEYEEPTFALLML